MEAIQLPRLRQIRNYNLYYLGSRKENQQRIKNVISFNYRIDCICSYCFIFRFVVL